MEAGTETKIGKSWRNQRQQRQGQRQRRRKRQHENDVGVWSVTARILLFCICYPTIDSFITPSTIAPLTLQTNIRLTEVKSNQKRFLEMKLFDQDPFPSWLSGGVAPSANAGNDTFVVAASEPKGIPGTSIAASEKSYHNSLTDDNIEEVNKWTTVMSHKFLDEESDPAVLEQLYQDLKDLSDFDTREVEKYWDKLMPTVSYLGTELCCKVYNALRVAYRAHRGQMRKSGEPFIIHPVEVALLLSGLKMDAETVMAGLLHDTVEDTDLTFDQVESIFGPVVRTIVEGETKVSKLPKLAFADYADEQAENLRQMFVAMSDDYRIIIVKLADRLHNMRTLRHMKPEKQIKISRETLDIFAPLAHRMGIWQFKSELEDTAFMYLYPLEYKRLNRRLRQHQTRFRQTLDKSQDILLKTLNNDKTLQEQAQNIQVHGRTKEIYSLWHKMETRGETNLNHIIDVVALRIIITPRQQHQPEQIRKRQTNHIQKKKTTTINGSLRAASGSESPADRGVWLCYHVLGLVQHLPGFQPMPTRVKDYISFPKPNGYQSLHTALMLSGQTIEVQIRTNTMHQVAEYGMASHWAYTDAKRRISKSGSLVDGSGSGSGSGSGTGTGTCTGTGTGTGSGSSSGIASGRANSRSPRQQAEIFNTPWLSSIKEWQDDSINSRDFVDSVRRELLGKRVFVFLRNGKILNLARGATAIDAAFQIHTEVGLNMHGVEINGKPVPLSYELQNGDVVSVLTGKGKPQTDWMRYAKSRSTKSKLLSYFRARQKESLREAGKILIMDYLWLHGALIEKSSYREEAPFTTPTTIEELATFLPGETQYKKIDDLLIDIGKKHDRVFLHTTIAKLFCVPQSLLIEAESNRSGISLVPSSVNDAVHHSRQLAMDAAEAVYDDTYSQQQHLKQQTRKQQQSVQGQKHQKHHKQHHEKQKFRSSLSSDLGFQKSAIPQVIKHVLRKEQAASFATIDCMLPDHDMEVEDADPEQVCTECLPIFGDEIIGTYLGDPSDAITTVHRVGCPIAQRAINAMHAKSKMSNISNINKDDGKKRGKVKNIWNNNSHRVDSVTLRMMRQNTNTNRSFTLSNCGDNISLVKLRWSDFPPVDDEVTNNFSFKAEIVIIAEDRKLLLADCSEIVSELSEIIKTGSSTTNEHATLLFLVHVSSLTHLQELMDQLGQVPSVLSVERRFGSELL